MFLVRVQTFLGRAMEISQLCESWYGFLMERYRADRDNSSGSTAFDAIGTISLRNGGSKNAIDWYRYCLEMEKRIHGDDTDHQNISVALHSLGLAAEETGDYDDA